MTLTTRRAVAEELADVSGEVIAPYFRQPRLSAETKDTISAIVTVADVAAEEAMRAVLAKKLPDDGVVGEEVDDIASTSGYSWVLDPIDGTSSFVRGFPIFGTLIGLVQNDSGEVELGVLNQPISGERLVGRRGESTTLNDVPVATPYRDDSSLSLDDVCLTSTTPLMFVTHYEQEVAARSQAACRRNAFGGDCFSYAALAAGFSSMPLVILESDMKYFDFCALIPIIEGAGGVITDWDGQPLGSSSTRVLAAPNRWVWEKMLHVISS